jgi:death-on-curing protein
MPAPPPDDVQYLDLADFLVLAGAALDLAPEDLFDTTDLGLTESALRAPAGAIDGIEFYPDLVTKTAILVIHLAKLHRRPLPDGNKRAAYLAMIEFLARNGRRFIASDASGTIDMMVRIADGEVDQIEVEDWIRRHLD